MDINGAMILTWGRPERGMENAAIQLLGRSVGFFDELIQSGRVTSRKIYLTPLGGRQDGMMVVEGERSKLDAIFWSKEYKLLHVQARTLLQEFEVTIGVGGEPEVLQGPTAVFQEALTQLDA